MKDFLRKFFSTHFAFPISVLKNEAIKDKHNFSKFVFTFIVFILLFFLLFIPTGFEGALQFKDAVKCKVLVTKVDNSSLIDTGLIRSGQQVCCVKFLSGKFKGQETEGWNMLSGSLAQDKLFKAGDKAQAIVHHDKEKIL